MPPLRLRPLFKTPSFPTETQLCLLRSPHRKWSYSWRRVSSTAQQHAKWKGRSAPLAERQHNALVFSSKHPHGISPPNIQASGRDRCLGRGALSVTYLHMLFGSALSTTHIGAYVWWRSVIWKQGTSAVAVTATAAAAGATRALRFPLNPAMTEYS